HRAVASRPTRSPRLAGRARVGLVRQEDHRLHPRTSRRRVEAFPGTAERRLSIARTLVARVPATLELLRRGQLTYLHAMKLAEAVVPFDTETAGKIEQRVLPRAPEQTLAQFGASLRRAVIAADPRRAEQRHHDALDQRRVVFTPQDDG